MLPGLTSMSGFTVGGAASWQTLVQPTLNTNAYGGFATYTMVQRIAVAAFSAVTGTPSKVRLTITADTTGGRTTAMNSVYIGNKATSGDAYDAASLTQVTWNTGSAGFSIAAGATIVSDEITISLDLTKDIIISLDWTNSGTTGIRGVASLANYSIYRKVGDEGSVADKTGYTTAGGTGDADATLASISKLEVFA